MRGAMKFQIASLIASPLFIALACGGKPTATAPIAVPAQSSTPVAPANSPPASSSVAAAPSSTAPATSAPPKPVFRITEGLSTPESVLYDVANDRYLVSNINGSPTDVDGNGYIVEVSPEGK